MSDSPTPVVLVHRAGGMAGEWDDVLAHRKREEPDRTWEAVDLPGRLRVDDHVGSVAAMAEHVVDRVIALGRGPALLAGHSMGGAVCLRAAVDFPAWVKGLVIIGSGASMTVPRAMQEALDRGVTLKDRAFASQALSPGLDEGRRDELIQRMGKVPFSVLRADLVASGRMRMRSRLSEITVPVRIIVGKDDRLVPPLAGMKLNDLIEGATLRTLPGVGHMIQWEAPGTLAEEIESMALDLDRG